MGADLGLRSLWVRVRALRRPLLVPPLAVLAASWAISLALQLKGLPIARASASAGARFRFKPIDRFDERKLVL